MAVTDTLPVAAGAPRWLAPSLEVKEGRDPLGLQTTTQDRLMPRLLPGILELSRRGRYLSFHAFLLDEYRRLRLPADSASLSTFIKMREWEYGLAVLHCPHQCGSVPVGAQSLRGVVNHDDPPYRRGESVESAFGGYGLYYRSPLAELGIVARAGTMLGDTPITVDVLYDTGRARNLADTFRSAFETTGYATGNWMVRADPLPVDVLADYAKSCCLCQLRHRHPERDAVHEALFGQDPDVHPPDDLTDTDDVPSPAPDGPGPIGSVAAVTQRRRSVAHYLTLVGADPYVVDDEGAYREALWSSPGDRSADHALVAGQWAGLIAKDVWQDALCSIWSEFCQAGVDADHAGDGDGLTWDKVRHLTQSLVAGPPEVAASMPTLDLVAGIQSGSVELPGLDGPLRDVPLEALRAVTDTLDTATSGLVVILELNRRAQLRSGAGWAAATRERSTWQPSVASVLDALTAHLDDGPVVADTLWWIAHQFVIGVHERIAYSKLPEHTFRFRWEDGRVRFFNNGIGRFPLAAIRHEPLQSLTADLDLWARDGERTAVLTAAGRSFIDETFT